MKENNKTFKISQESEEKPLTSSEKLDKLGFRVKCHLDNFLKHSEIYIKIAQIKQHKIS